MAATVIGWSAALLGAGWWALALGAGVATTRALVGLSDEPDREVVSPQERPSISIVVAARDEAQTLRHDVEAFARHAEPGTELVLVDDRSTDGTGQLVDQAAQADPRIRALHVRELPDGWLGKVHALEQGRLHASGDWLLFTDADVELAPDLPRRAVALARRHRLDALALLPSVHCRGWLVASAVGTFSRWLVVGARLWRAADPERPDAFGVGACNLVRASALDAAGGLSWLRLDVADDAALAQLVAASGGRTMLGSGTGMVSVEWQQSVRGMTRGFEKYGGTGGAGSVRAAIVLASIVAALELAPLLALVLGIANGSAVLVTIAAGTLVASVGVGVLLSRAAGGPWRGALLPPVGTTLVWWMQVRAAWLEHRRGGVVWRDTFYASDALRAGKRYRLPGVDTGSHPSSG